MKPNENLHLQRLLVRSQKDIHAHSPVCVWRGLQTVCLLTLERQLVFDLGRIKPTQPNPTKAKATN